MFLVHIAGQAYLSNLDLASEYYILNGQKFEICRARRNLLGYVEIKK